MTNMTDVTLELSTKDIIREFVITGFIGTLLALQIMQVVG